MPYIQNRDDMRLFYIDAGTGKPIVFVASAWLNSRMWEFQIPYLVDHGFRCIAYDRRGHGRSDCTWERYDYDTLADASWFRAGREDCDHLGHDPPI